MRFLVIAKHVPDTRIALRLKPDGSGLEAGGLKYVCDPFDEIAIEQAAQLKAAAGSAAEVVVMSVGGPAVIETLRHGLALGADRAVHVRCDDLQPHEELRSTKLCASAIEHAELMQPELLILSGARNTDNGAGEFGPALAEMLDLPHAGAVTKLELRETTLRVNSRCIAGGELLLKMQTPAFVMCERGLIEPRHPALPKLMKAKKQPIETIDAAQLGVLDAKLRRLMMPPTKQSCRFIEGEPEQAARELLRLLREEAHAL